MSLVQRTPNRIRRLGTLAAAAALASILVASPAAAATSAPIRIDFAYGNEFSDPDTCAADGLVLDVVERVHGTYLEWDDANGDFVRATETVFIEFEIAGSNGVTLFERDRIVRQITTDGYREIGLWEHVNGPSGVVIIDAGQLVFDNDGNVVFEPGRHDFFHGLSSFCPGFFE